MKKILHILILLIFILAPHSNSLAEAPTPPPIPKPTYIQLKQYSVTALLEHYAEEYDINLVPLKKVAFCESGFNEKAFNGNDPNGGSKGFMQFQTKTFYSYANKAGIENANITDKVHQAQVAAYMFSIGEADQWTTYRALMNGGTYTFWSNHEKRYITVYCK